MTALLEESRIEDRLSLSTCWNSSRHTDGYEMLVEIRELGFRSAELSHGVPSYLVEGILRAVKEGVVEISSVHNFCPLPSMARGAAPNLFQPSGRSRQERRSWFRYSVKTIEFARDLGARHVVMHSGSLGFRFGSAESLLSGLQHEKARKQEKAWKTLRRRAGREMKRVRNAYESLMPFAEEAGVQLGVENREGLLELPLDEKMKGFLETMDHPSLGYWHDTGHAELKQGLGIIDHQEHLESLQDHLVGFHLHDVSGEGKDHQRIGSGSIDFNHIASCVRPHHVLVLELHPRLSQEDVLASRENLLEAFG
ncbi:MAG: sugar phosphate isomerase/epimerase [Verrucomicrobiales bacterium]|nr:sugar phosphate isomerase/epimerase [Verrucomicrobiales bacterium]